MKPAIIQRRLRPTKALPETYWLSHERLPYDVAERYVRAHNRSDKLFEYRIRS